MCFFLNPTLPSRSANFPLISESVVRSLFTSSLNSKYGYFILKIRLLEHNSAPWSFAKLGCGFPAPSTCTTTPHPYGWRSWSELQHICWNRWESPSLVIFLTNIPNRRRQLVLEVLPVLNRGIPVGHSEKIVDFRFMNSFEEVALFQESLRLILEVDSLKCFVIEALY